MRSRSCHRKVFRRRGATRQGRDRKDLAHESRESHEWLCGESGVLLSEVEDAATVVEKSAQSSKQEATAAHCFEWCYGCGLRHATTGARIPKAAAAPHSKNASALRGHSLQSASMLSGVMSAAFSLVMPRGHSTSRFRFAKRRYAQDDRGEDVIVGVLRDAVVNDVGDTGDVETARGRKVSTRQYWLLGCFFRAAGSFRT
jgi:hypothetical protein